jgi:DNA-binding transcriptional LysR family regulator
MAPDPEAPLRVGFVPGVTPDKWARRWAEQMPLRPLDLVPLDHRDGVALVRGGDLDMCFVRLPVDRGGLHLIPLYDEQPVVVVSTEHPVAAYDEIGVEDLADEHLLQDVYEVPAWRDVATEVAEGSRHPVPTMTLSQALESVAADAGILILPMSLARLHHRKDVTHVPLQGVPPTTIGLAWPEDADDERIERFIGVVRGRTANSSRTLNSSSTTDGKSSAVGPRSATRSRAGNGPRGARTRRRR